ncbi:hypothetical protein DBV15_11363 [Temnothorax longispinosus]|uniref:Uncharacterized protein n=1 Tax=Temnothorax longispinosus TaxID=300112 RepID=A0A4S2KMF1_9HYME|nr:hypothetical protein DBV15_11363 [Temnothorax longispinosus]
MKTPLRMRHERELHLRTEIPIGKTRLILGGTCRTGGVASTWRDEWVLRESAYTPRSLHPPSSSTPPPFSSLLVRRHSSPYRQWRLRPGCCTVSLTRGVLLDYDRKMPKSSTRLSSSRANYRREHHRGATPTMSNEIQSSCNSIAFRVSRRTTVTKVKREGWSRDGQERGRGRRNTQKAIEDEGTEDGREKPLDSISRCLLGRDQEVPGVPLKRQLRNSLAGRRSDEARAEKNGGRRKEERRRRRRGTRRSKRRERARAAMLEGGTGGQPIEPLGRFCPGAACHRPNRAESADARLTRSCSLRRDQDSPARGARRNTTARYDPLENRTGDRARASGHSSDRKNKQDSEKERKKGACIEIRPEKSSSEYIRRPSIPWTAREDEDGDEKRGEKKRTKGGLIRGHRIGYSNLLVSPGIYILFWSESYIGRSFFDSLHYDQDDNGNDNDSLPPTVPGIDLANDPGLTLICRPSRYYRIAEITPWLIYLAPNRFFLSLCKVTRRASFAREGLNGWRDWRAHFVRNDITARCYVRREETIVSGNVKTRFVVSMGGAKRNSLDSIRLPRTDLKTLLGEKGNVVITTGIATEIPGSNVAHPATNRLEDDIRRGERGGEYAKYLFPLTLAARDRAEGKKTPGVRESDYEAR